MRCTFSRCLSCLFLLLGLCIAVWSDDGSMRTFTDLCGRKVAVPGKIDKVVALGPGALRLVVYLEAVDRIVGIEDMEKRMASDHYVRPYARKLDNSFQKLPVVSAGGPGRLPDFEAVMLVHPDIVIVSGVDASSASIIEQKTGIPTIYVTYGELGEWGKEMQTSLSLLGEILGKKDRSLKIINYVESLEKDLKKRTENIEKRPSVYFGGISYKGSHGLTSTQAGYMPGAMINALNVADALEQSGHQFVDKEQIMLWNPDVVFVDLGSKLIMEQDFCKNPAFYRSLKAVGTGNVFSLLPYNYYNTNIELALLNAFYAGKVLYPDRFNDVDIRSKASEIFQMFIGMDAPVDIHAYRKVNFFGDERKIEW